MRRQLADKFNSISVGKTMAMKNQEESQNSNWPPRTDVFGELLTPIEAAQYLRLDETGTAVRNLLRNIGRRYLGILKLKGV